MKKLITIIYALFLLLTPVLAEGWESRIVDEIVIDGTWMTRDIIVLSKLGFEVGDEITPSDLELAEKNLYELKLFSKVEFSWSEEGEASTLHVLAKDQLHIMPLVAVDGASKTLKLGAADGNFLGFNVDLSLGYEQEKEFSQYDFVKRRIVGSVGLPDTLLNGFTFEQEVNIGIDGNKEHNIATDFSLPTRWFNDWLWSFEFAKEFEIQYDSENGIVNSGLSEDSWNIGTKVEPELHMNLFPAFSLSWKTTDISSEGVKYEAPFTGGSGNSFLNLGAELTYGEILTKNSYFQKNGWEATGEYTLGIKTGGEESLEKVNHKVEIGAEGHWLAFKWLELAGYFNYGVTSSEMPSNTYNIQLHSTRDRSAPGLTVRGTNYYSLTTQAHFTYVNFDWFALEHVAWFDLARGADNFSGLFDEAPKMAVGTGLRLRIPNIPWLYFYIDVQWALPKTGQDVWGIKI